MVTSTTIQADSGLFANSIFEFQHNSDKDLLDSFFLGFEAWRNYELPVLLDAFEIDANKSEGAVFPKADSTKQRKVTFGTPYWLKYVDKSAESEDTTKQDKHDFCPCCLFTNKHVFETMKEFLNSDQLAAVKLVAIRTAGGAPDADCRVSGIPYLPGKKALLEYVKEWAGKGMEVRKSYILFRDINNPQ